MKCQTGNGKPETGNRPMGKHNGQFHVSHFPFAVSHSPFERGRMRKSPVSYQEGGAEGSNRHSNSTPPITPSLVRRVHDNPSRKRRGTAGATPAGAGRRGR